MSQPARCVAAIALGLFALVPAPARATVMLALDLHQMVGRSDKIFVGKVLEVRSRWTDDRRHIVTDATVEVERDVQGTRARERIVVRRLGGTVGGIGMRVAGAAVLQRGDRLLLFTELRRGHRFVVGMRQGLFKVLSAAGGELVLARDLRGLSLVDRKPDRLDQLRPDDREDLGSRPAIKTMIARVRTAISECRTQPHRCRVPVAR